MPQKELGHYPVGNSKPGEWHGHMGQIDIFKKLLKEICGKWLAERLV